MNAIAYGLGQVIGLLSWVGIFYVIAVMSLPPWTRRRVLRLTGRLIVRLVWALLCAPALGLLWVVRRFDEVPVRRQAWQFDHAAECRGLARQYEGKARAHAADLTYPGGALTAGLLYQDAAALRRLADLFEADATDDADHIAFRPAGS